MSSSDPLSVLAPALNSSNVNSVAKLACFIPLTVGRAYYAHTGHAAGCSIVPLSSMDVCKIPSNNKLQVEIARMYKHR